jgi:hypothetical protein
MRRTFLVTVSNPHILIKKWLLKHLSYMRHFLGEDSSLVGRNSLRENQEHALKSMFVALLYLKLLVKVWIFRQMKFQIKEYSLKNHICGQRDGLDHVTKKYCEVVYMLTDLYVSTF